MSVCPHNTKQKFLQHQSMIQLKKLRKKIFKLTKNRDQKIKNLYRQLAHKNIQVCSEINKIVSGEKSQVQIQLKSQLCSEMQGKQSNMQNNYQNINCQMSIKNDGIHNYWKNILLATYGDCIKKQQLSILDYLKLISVKQYNNNKSSISFTFRNGHHLIDEGNYTKTIFKNQQGQPISYEGDQVSNCRKLRRGFFKTILQSTRQIDKLRIIDSFIEIFCQQMIPRSLTYYLQVRVKQNPQLLSQVSQKIEVNKINEQKSN